MRSLIPVACALLLFTSSSLSAQKLAWVKPVSSESFAAVNTIESDDAGNCYAHGWFSDSVLLGDTVIRHAGLYSQFLAKFSADGSLLWVRTGSMADHRLDSHLDMEVDCAGNVYILFSVDGPGNFARHPVELKLRDRGQGDFVRTTTYLAKLNPFGEILWIREFMPGSATRAFTMELSRNDNLSFAGIFRGSIAIGESVLTANDAYGDLVVAGADLEGNLLWGRHLPAADWTSVTRMTTDNHGNCYVTGTFSHSLALGDSLYTIDTSQTYNGDLFLAAFNPNGRLLFGRRMGGRHMDFSHAVEVDASGNIWVAGAGSDTMRFESNPGYRTSIGKSQPQHWTGFFAGYRPDGEFIDGRRYFNIKGLECGLTDLSRDRLGRMYAVGYSQGRIVVDNDTLPSSDHVSDRRSGGIVMRYDADGNVEWKQAFFGSGEGVFGRIAFDNVGGFYLTGSWIGELPFSTDTPIVVGDYKNGRRDYFIARILPDDPIVSIPAMPCEVEN